MSKSRVALMVMLMGSVVLFARAQSPDLPDAPIAAKVKTTCAECHDTRMIVQQRLSKATWAKEVDKMTKWGALVETGDREQFIDYLSSNFPPEKAPYVAPREARSRK